MEGQCHLLSVTSIENSQCKHKRIKPQIGMCEHVFSHQKHFYSLSFILEYQLFLKIVFKNYL